MAPPNQGSPEARGLGVAKQIGPRVSKALNQTAAKPVNLFGKPIYGAKPSASVVPSHRYKRSFCLRSPGTY